MKISIIIATWNAGRTLRDCLDSIVPQINKDIELIIVDGCSKDDTNEIISSYGEKVSYTISEPDNGIYDAWNKGVKVAKGNWVAFIGADDVLLPNALKTYLDCINSTPEIDSYDYICALNEHVDENGKILKVLGGKPDWNIYRYQMNAAHVASLHNRHNLFETIGGYDLQFKICADYDLLLRKRDKLRSVFIPVHIARMKVGGMSFSVKAIKETFLVRKKNRSLPLVINCIIFFINIIAFKFFIYRKRLFGAKF